jgi:uncharacterized protein
MPSQQIKDKGKVFRDPVHRLIRIEQQDQFVLDLVNTPEFQRLRRVRQLGVSSLTYHGAEHSRFVHSLGVFNFAQRIMTALQRRYGTDSAVSKLLQDHARITKAAALLHDIGHGPFSHMIERASESTFDHEKMTVKLITREGGSIRQVLAEADVNPQLVADVINKTYPYRLLVDVVSSQLDADRMDYLLRDSLMTGVEYGVYDAEWLLNAMCVGRDPSDDSDSPAESAWRLCLDKDRGLFAAEQLILARHHMMLQVYMHRVTRGYEVMLLNLFRKAAVLARSDSLPPGTPRSVVSYFKAGIDMDTEDWLLFDETAMVAAMQAWSLSESPEHGFLRKASRAFLTRDRLYMGFELGTRRPSAIMELTEGLAKQNLVQNEDWGLDDGVHLPYKGVYHQASRGGGEEEMSVLSILLSDGKPESKGIASENESAILKQFDNASQPIARIYVDREKVELAKPLLKKLGVRQGGAA